MVETSMSVGDLKAVLADLPDALPIIMSSDSEGNSYDNLWDASLTKFCSGSGKFWTVHPDDIDTYDPEDLFDALGLWP